MSASTATPTRVLVVSATSRVLGGLRPLLEAAGYEVLLFHAAQQDARISLEATIEGIVQAFSPGLLVLDINFGEESAGWQLIQALYLLPGAAALPWVVCIGATEYAQGLVPHLLKQGIQVVLKPFTTDDLLQQVRAACPPMAAIPPWAPASEHVELSDPRGNAEDSMNGDQRHRRAPDGPTAPDASGRRGG